jgi:hypothetical protein
MRSTRFLLIVLAVWLGFVSIASAATIATDKVIYSWDFENATDTLGWKASEEVEVDVEVRDGALWMTTKGTRSWIASPEIELRANSRQYFRMTVNNSRGRGGSIYWGTEGEDGKVEFRAGDVRPISAARTLGTHTTCVVPEWEEGLVIRKLRVRSPYKASEYGVVKVEILERAEGLNPWLPDADISDSWIEAGELVAIASGPSPRLISPPLSKDASEMARATFKLASKGAEIAQVLFKSEQEGFDVSRAAWLELVGDDRFHAYMLDLRGLPGYRGKIERLALELGTTERGDEIRMEYVNIVPDEGPWGPADVWIEKFTIDPVVSVKGDEVLARMWIRNSGGTASNRLYARLVPGEGIRAGNAQQMLPKLEAGERREVRWTIVIEKEGRELSAVAELQEGKEVRDSREAKCVSTGEMNLQHLDNLLESGTKARVTEPGMAFAGNGNIAAYLPPSEYGYGPGFLMIYKDESWKPVAAWKSLGELVILNDKGEIETHEFTTSREDLEAFTSGYYVDLELRSWWEDSDGRKWKVIHTFSAEGDKRMIEVSAELECDGDGKVLAFRPLEMLALGEERELGFFPGLEYLVEGERSSGMEFVRYPYNERLVPNPYKITMPLMAVIKDGVAVGMMWDPLQKWDGENYLPNAMFASPNFVDGESDHLMSIFVPSQPEWVDENSPVAKEPYPLAAGKRLRVRMKMFAREGEDFDAVLAAYLGETRGLPPTPEMAYDYEEAIRGVMYEYAHITFEKELVQWHRFLPDPKGPAYLPERVLHLFWELKKGTYKEVGKDIEELFNYVVEKRGKGNLGGVMPYYYGPVRSLIRGESQWIDGFLRQQKEDGSYPFVPREEKHVLLGTPGDSSSGYTAEKLQQVWRHAAQTGDERAIQAGLRGLEYLESQVRPEGAQTWELQLHVPDILASANVIPCYLYAYKITRDEKFLEEAVKWAYRGMPFVYLWNPPERPVMRYGTIPVFGGSWFKGGWFGKIVQWNGLRYATALLELAKYDDSVDWRKVAKGIVDSAIAQQRPISREGYKFADYIPDCGHPGMYPDAYSARKGGDEYHWCLSGQGILETLYDLLGENPASKLEVIWDEEGEKWVSVSSVAYVEEPLFEDGRLEMNLRIMPGLTHHVAINRAEEPKRVILGGKELKAEEDLDAAGEGYTYSESGRVVVIKVDQEQEEVTLKVEF